MFQYIVPTHIAGKGREKGRGKGREGKGVLVQHASLKRGKKINMSCFTAERTI